MAMNKKEQAEMERLRDELRLAKALRFTEKVEPDVPIPESFSGLAKGFLYNSYLAEPRVVPACSSSVSHGWGNSDRTTTQQPRRLYSTRLLALRACRHDLEKQCAKLLADIDAQIENETTRTEGT
jgi:hypothetical protein